MAKRFTAAELEAMTAAERAEAVKAAVVSEPSEADEELLARGRARLAERFTELTG